MRIQVKKFKIKEQGRAYEKKPHKRRENERDTHTQTNSRTHYLAMGWVKGGKNDRNLHTYVCMYVCMFGIRLRQ